MKHIISLILVIAVAVNFGSPTHAQDSDDASKPQLWQGVLDVGGQKLTMNFEVTVTGDEFSGSVATPEQGNQTIPLSSMSIEDGNVEIEVDKVGGKFTGKLNEAGDQVVGVWQQRGNELEMTINKVDSFDSGEHIETWKGTLDVGVKLEMGLKVYRQKDGSLTAKLDSYTQNVTGIPIEFEKDGDTYKMSHSGMQMEYEGKLNEEETKLEGTFTQAGREIELNMEKVELNYEAEEKKRPQEPKEPFDYDSTDVTYENEVDALTLAGTLTTPKGDGPFPAAILISGSGSQNRNEELLGHKPFLVIADYLTRNGIAVLRFDDRGVGESTGEFETSNSADFAKDVAAAVDFLKTQTKIDAGKIGLVGHSEGGLIAPMLAANREDVAFIVMMAGPGVDGMEILKSQSQAILQATDETAALLEANMEFYSAIEKLIDAENQLTAESITAASDDVLANIEDEAVREQMQAAVQPTVDTLTGPWMNFFIQYDPEPTLKQVKCPVLAINGEKDLQVLVDLNLDAIEKSLQEGGNTNFEIVRMPNMNHLFQETDGDGSPAEYGNIEETFSPKALKVISDWIRKQTS